MPDLDKLGHLRRVVLARIETDDPLDMSVFWHPCGTFGCVAGWAAQDPFFQSIGLKVVQGRYGGNAQGVLLWERRRFGVPYTLSAFAALEELFGLDEWQACYLFGNNPEITGAEPPADWHEVLSRVDEVIRGDC